MQSKGINRKSIVLGQYGPYEYWIFIDYISHCDGEKQFQYSENGNKTCTMMSDAIERNQQKKYSSRSIWTYEYWIFIDYISHCDGEKQFQYLENGNKTCTMMSDAIERNQQKKYSSRSIWTLRVLDLYRLY
ncbi:hypothetical protein ACOME3_008702 [Neoechinorhynchus agilis]